MVHNYRKSDVCYPFNFLFFFFSLFVDTTQLFWIHSILFSRFFHISYLLIFLFAKYAVHSWYCSNFWYAISSTRKQIQIVEQCHISLQRLYVTSTKRNTEFFFNYELCRRITRKWSVFLSEKFLFIFYFIGANISSVTLYTF